MQVIPETLCDGADCDRKGPVSHMPIKQGGAVNFCTACLSVALGSHNKAEKKDEDGK